MGKWAALARAVLIYMEGIRRRHEQPAGQAVLAWVRWRMELARLAGCGGWRAAAGARVRRVG